MYIGENSLRRGQRVNNVGEIPENNLYLYWFPSYKKIIPEKFY